MVRFSSQTLLRNYLPPKTNRHFCFSRNCKSLKMLNVKHSSITFTRNELQSMRASACPRPYMINSINNCAIDIYRRKRRTHRGGCRKQHKINVVSTHACLTPTFIVKQHGSNLSNLHFPMYRSRQSITSSLTVASRSVVNRKKQRLVKVGTFNVRTLRTDFRAFELQKLAADLKIDVLVMQEHRRSKSDVDFQRSLPKGWQILLGAPSAPGVGGIGFLLSSQCSPWLLDYKFVTDRVAVANFDIGNRRLHIICVYAPTASVTLSDTKESVDFYDCVSTLISNIPSRDLQIVCGDFNAPLQRDGHRVKNSCGIPTVNSDLLTQFIEANDLIPMNGYLRQKTNQLPTF